MSSTSAKLHRARQVKNDEFYTQLCDIEIECQHYLRHFKNKIIYCNCDTDDSNFVKYFQRLKRNGLIKDVLWSGGLGGLDFRSPNAIEMLKKADIVVSNPPFSLFREYVAQLTEHDKKFLIIGNHNAVKYDYMFPLIKDNKVWAGTRPFGGALSMLFNVPHQDDLIASGKYYSIINGVAMARISAAWFTNLSHNQQKRLILHKKYHGNESDYPKYDNFDAININRKGNIPVDYYGVMGVSITFIDRYNPAQFEILGLDKELTHDQKSAAVNGQGLYTRIFIRRRISLQSEIKRFIMSLLPNVMATRHS